MATPRSTSIAFVRCGVLLLLVLMLPSCEKEETSVARESALRQNLAASRRALRMFREDKKRHPHTLDELVPNYLRAIPNDPVANAPLVAVTEEPVAPSTEFDGTSAAPAARPVVIDVRSSAPGVDSNGVRYSDY